MLLRLLVAAVVPLLLLLLLPLPLLLLLPLVDGNDDAGDEAFTQQHRKEEKANVSSHTAKKEKEKTFIVDII